MEIEAGQPETGRPALLYMNLTKFSAGDFLRIKKSKFGMCRVGLYIASLPKSAAVSV